MATQKPISTISYNTEPFLREKLDAWVAAHVLSSFQYIIHKGEDGDKDHIHLRVEPNRRLDTMDLSADLREFVKGQDKPLGVLTWRQSKEYDWILYALHDPEYMRSKYPDDRCEKIPYDWKKIVASDGYDVETVYLRAKASLRGSAPNIAKRLSEGASGSQLVQEGANPFSVNVIGHILRGSDYERLASDHEKLRSDFNALLIAVKRAGFAVIADGDGVRLEKVDG